MKIANEFSGLPSGEFSTRMPRPTCVGLTADICRGWMKLLVYGTAESEKNNYATSIDMLIYPLVIVAPATGNATPRTCHATHDLQLNPGHPFDFCFEPARNHERNIKYILIISGMSMMYELNVPVAH